MEAGFVGAVVIEFCGESADGDGGGEAGVEAIGEKGLWDGDGVAAGAVGNDGRDGVEGGGKEGEKGGVAVDEEAGGGGVVIAEGAGESAEEAAVGGVGVLGRARATRAAEESEHGRNLRNERGEGKDSLCDRRKCLYLHLTGGLTMKFLRRILRVFRRNGTPYLAFVSTVFCLVGIVMCWCRPAIAGVASRVGGGTPVSYGKTSGSILAGDKCGQGGDVAIIVGVIFLAVGFFLVVVGYQVTTRRTKEAWWKKF